MDRTPTTIPGIDLIAGAAALQWYEAVALIVKLAETIKQVGSVPDLPHIQLSTDGTIAILPGSPLSEQPVTQLAVTLRSLLQPALAPPELVQVVAQAAEGRSGQDIDAFAESLRYFESPAREIVLDGVIERVAISASRARMEQELKELAEKARSAPPKPPATGRSRGRRPWGRAIAVLLVLVIAAAAAVVVWWPFRFPSTGVGSAASSLVSQAGQGIAQAFNGSVERLFGARATTQTPDLSDTASLAPKPAPRAESRKRKARDIGALHAVAARFQAAAADAPSLILPSTVASSSPAIVLLPPDVVQTMADSDPEPSRIYSQMDPDVTAPVPLQPVIGRIASDATSIPGDMDILVGRTGEVERVTLLVPNSYQDRMLIYAMKNHQFKPAIAHGRPVRYLLRMRTAF